MTDDASIEEANEGPDFLDQPPGHDWMLAWLVAHVEAFGIEFGITLSVGGQSVSGTLISGRKYFQDLRESLSSVPNLEGDLAKSLAKSMTLWSEVYPEKPEDVDIYNLKPNFIHLRNARVVTPGGAVPNNGALWRGKISAVDGFSVGELDTD